MHHEDANATSVSPSEKCNPPDQYSYTDTLNPYANMEVMQQQKQLELQSDYPDANTADQVKTNTHEYANVDSDGNVIETDPEDGMHIYAEVNKPRKLEPILPQPVDNEGEYAEYGPAPTVPDKKY